MIHFLVTSISVLSSVVGGFSVLMIIVGALRYVVSNGDGISIRAAKNTILYAVVAVTVSTISYAVVTFVLSGFVSVAGPSLWDLVIVSTGLPVAVEVSRRVLARRSSRLLRWIACYSAFWMPEAEREDHMNDMWCALRHASPMLRVRLAAGLLVSSPLSGLRSRRRDTRRAAEVAIELERLGLAPS